MMQRAAIVMLAMVGANPALHAQAGARLDHVIVIVHDLDSAAAPYAALGFRFKAGRLHANNLLNRHIKFRDGTEIELMSLAGPPGDSMAIRYAALLERGAGGAYVALKAENLDSIAAAAERLGLATRLTAAGPWRFLGFPGGSDASGVFFASGDAPVSDPDSIFAHANGAVSLAEAWVEGGPRLASLLAAAGGAPSGRVGLPDGRCGTRWRLARGSVVIVPRTAPDGWPRPVGVVLGRGGSDPAALDDAAATPRMPHGIWIVLRD